MFCIKNHIISALMISQLTIYCAISSAQQHSVGFSGGYNTGKFFNFSKNDDYDTKYHLKSGFSVASFYEAKMDSISNFRVELQYRFQNADMAIDYNAGHASFYKNLNYSFHLLNLNLLYAFEIVNRKSFKINIVLGPTLSFVTNIRARGNGWDYQQVTQVDTLGNPVSSITTQDWEKNERNSKDLSMFNIGVDLGLDFIIPVRDQLDFLIQNKYNIIINNILKLDNIKPTSLFTGSLQLGIRYKLKGS